MIKGYIYKIETPSGKIYIGQTINIKSRINHYRSVNCIKKQLMLYNDAVKYDYIPGDYLEVIEEFEFDETIINTDNDNLLDEREIHWIEKFKTYAHENNLGLNLTKGGKSRKGYVTSEETKKKLSNAHKGKKLSEEHKLKIGRKGIENHNYGKKSVMRGIPRTEETKQKISESQKGKKLSIETREKISKAQIGREPWNKGLVGVQQSTRKGVKTGIKPPNRVKINAYIYETGEYVGTYDSYIDCAKELNIPNSHISCVVNGKRKHTKGYTFEKV